LAEIGTILGGRYRLVELLGEGGMATIFRAVDTQLGRDVAIKLLRPEYLRDPDFSSRFRQEAQNAASLNHPNVVSVYDYGEDPSGPYIVMELIDGEDLATILRRTGPLPPAQAARIAAAVARALAAAHARGIVHRDVKPGNVLIGRDGRVKVVDFGIARAVAEAQMTLPGTTLGSVHYFSPEQARGETSTNESDIYSLGIVLYEMLTGTRPWEGDSAASVALARLSGPVPDPVVARPAVPPDLAAITRKALASSPIDRFASAASMADALETSRTAAGAAGAPGLAAAAGAGAGAGAAGLGGGTAVGRVPASSGIARSNPNVNAYPPDAYASGDDGRASRRTAERPRPRPRIEEDVDEREEGTSPLVWLAGLGAIVLLAAIAFLVFQLLSTPGAAPAAKVAVPELVGKLLADATQEADGLGLKLESVDAPSDQPVGTIIAQQPPKDTLVDPGSTIQVTVAQGLQQVPMPDLRNRTEAQAVQEIVTAGLVPGVKTEAFDPVVAPGLVVTQSPAPGVVVAKETPVDYTISKGPEPTSTPTPTPTPTPVPTPTPTPVPTPPPTPTPTPTPTPPPEPTPTPS
jgi:eukaryotic-like serine/threonine-protein kinase